MNDNDRIPEEPIAEAMTESFPAPVQTELEQSAVEQAFAAPEESEDARTAELAPPLPPLPPLRDEPFYNETVRNRRKPSGKAKRFRRIAALVVAASMLGGAMLGFGAAVGTQLAKSVWIPGMLDDSKQIQAFQFPERGANSLTYAESPVMSYREVAKKVEASTVTITSTAESATQWFDVRIPQERVGAGTGILFYETDANYYIATNAHVISGASAVSVSITGSGDIAAKPVGKDVEADLAVISVSKADVTAAGITGVTIAAFGDSDEMEPGDFVLAVGNSVGEGNIVTNGIISSKEKEITIERRALTVLQTNAAINQGNSGGPLVNLAGEVIGINTAKLSGTGTASVEGTGYAIPSNVAMPIITRLMQSKQNGKPIIGIRGRDVSEDEAEQYNLPPIGVMVASVEDGLPAAKAGLKTGDIITGIDDEPVMSMTQLQASIQTHKIGDQVTIKILRDGKDSLTLTMTLAEDTISGF